MGLNMDANIVRWHSLQFGFTYWEFTTIKNPFIGIPYMRIVCCTSLPTLQILFYILDKLLTMRIKNHSKLCLQSFWQSFWHSFFAFTFCFVFEFFSFHSQDRALLAPQHPLLPPHPVTRHASSTDPLFQPHPCFIPYFCFICCRSKGLQGLKRRPTLACSTWLRPCPIRSSRWRAVDAQ